MTFNNSVNASQTGIQTVSSSGQWTGSTVGDTCIVIGGPSNSLQTVSTLTVDPATGNITNDTSTTAANTFIKVSNGGNVINGNVYMEVGCNAVTSPFFRTRIGNAGYCIGQNGGSSASSLAIYSGSGSVSPTTGTLILKSTAQGIITKPRQPAFFFYLNSNTSANKTGDGTPYTLGTDALTSGFQQGSDMSTGGTITPHSAGFYALQVTVYLFGLLVGHTNCELAINGLPLGGNIVASLNPYVASISGEIMVQGSCMVNLDAANPVTFSVTVSGATPVVGIGGVSGNLRTYVSGTLLC